MTSGGNWAYTATPQDVINIFNRTTYGRLIHSYHHGFYLHNARGDVVQRVEIVADNLQRQTQTFPWGTWTRYWSDTTTANILFTYQYDGFGNLINSFDSTGGVSQNNSNNNNNQTCQAYEDWNNSLEQNTNPFRFAGEYYDWSTQTYYLRARHFNPRTGRFTQPDPFWNTRNMQSSNVAILQSGNLFAYTMNNPIRFIDPTGMYAVNILDYVRARGANVTMNNSGGARVSFGSKSAFFADIGSRTMDDRAINSLFGWSSFLTQEDRNAGVGIVITNNRLYRNVTAAVNRALNSATSTARLLNFPLHDFPGATLHAASWFVYQMYHGGPWDIKVPGRWRGTLGIPATYVPGHTTFQQTYFYFRGMRMRPEDLGNWTFGYIGAAVGFNLEMLLFGSWFVAGRPTEGDALIEEQRDWIAIGQGYSAFSRRWLRGWAESQ
ncbi:MAG: polymorphic toxin type 44 domain-containing protein [Defluviitaleaceae bacterium]|nr:polymorphic toxin type 44 domain-containing protein [Defluviitaleaceae bacterium]